MCVCGVPCKTEEYKKLKSEIQKVSSKAAAVETGAKAKQRQVGSSTSSSSQEEGPVSRLAEHPSWVCACLQAEQGAREMLTPLEQRRQKFLQRKKQGGAGRCVAGHCCCCCCRRPRAPSDLGMMLAW